MDQYTSKKIQVISFWGIVCVIFLHSGIPSVTEGFFPLISRFLCENIGSIFRPLFFSLAGYLFFLDFKPTWKVVIGKWNRRFYSLLIPFVCGCLIFAGTYSLFDSCPVIEASFNTKISKILRAQDAWQNFHFLFLQPVAFHLWFLQRLILFALAAPALFPFFRTKCLWGLSLCVTGILCVWFYWADDLFFFLLGSGWAVNHIALRWNASREKTWTLIGCFILFPLVCNIFSPPGGYILPYGFLFAALWIAYDQFAAPDGGCPRWLEYFIPYSFFLYLFHEPSLNIFKKLLLKLPCGDARYYITLFLAPILLILTLGWLGHVGERMFPRTFSFITGGRTSRRKFNTVSKPRAEEV